MILIFISRFLHQKKFYCWCECNLCDTNCVYDLYSRFLWKLRMMMMMMMIDGVHGNVCDQIMALSRRSPYTKNQFQHMTKITNVHAMAHHHFDEPLDDFVAVVVALVSPFAWLWSAELVFVSFWIVDDVVLKISKKIRPTLQIPFLLCRRAHFVHTFACRFRHIIERFVCLVKNIVGTFANCVCNLFDLQFQRQANEERRKKRKLLANFGQSHICSRFWLETTWI